MWTKPILTYAQPTHILLITWNACLSVSFSFHSTQSFWLCAQKNRAKLYEHCQRKSSELIDKWLFIHFQLKSYHFNQSCVLDLVLIQIKCSIFCIQERFLIDILDFIVYGHLHCLWHNYRFCTLSNGCTIGKNAREVSTFVLCHRRSKYLSEESKPILCVYAWWPCIKIQIEINVLQLIFKRILLLAKEKIQ